MYYIEVKDSLPNSDMIVKHSRNKSKKRKVHRVVVMGLIIKGLLPV